MTLRIDAHQHFWQIAGRDGYCPPHTLDVLYRDFGPHDLEPLLTRSNVQRTVIDHAAKPPVASGRSGPQHFAMNELAELSNVHGKLSGLGTQAGPHPDLARVEPYVRAACEWFGASRLIWGSARLAWCEQCCEHFLGPGALAGVSGSNACRFYRIDRPSDDRQAQHRGCHHA